MAEPTGNGLRPERQPEALGLPEGSVRAMLALGLCGVFWLWLVRHPERPLPAGLRDLLFIILGHYFATRRGATVDASSSPRHSPLFLPTGTIRLALIVGFVAVGLFLYRSGGLGPLERSPAAVTLLLVAAFFLGVLLSRVREWAVSRGYRPGRLLMDLRALFALLAAFLLVVLLLDDLDPFLLRRHRELPLPAAASIIDRVSQENLLAAVVGFYFGSRS